MWVSLCVMEANDGAPDDPSLKVDGDCSVVGFRCADAISLAKAIVVVVVLVVD